METSWCDLAVKEKNESFRKRLRYYAVAKAPVFIWLLIGVDRYQRIMRFLSK